jgi:hypothetical protein
MQALIIFKKKYLEPSQKSSRYKYEQLRIVFHQEYLFRFDSFPWKIRYQFIPNPKFFIFFKKTRNTDFSNPVARRMGQHKTLKDKHTGEKLFIFTNPIKFLKAPIPFLSFGSKRTLTVIFQNHY